MKDLLDNITREFFYENKLFGPIYVLRIIELHNFIDFNNTNIDFK